MYSPLFKHDVITVVGDCVGDIVCCVGWDEGRVSDDVGSDVVEKLELLMVGPEVTGKDVVGVEDPQIG